MKKLVLVLIIVALMAPSALAVYVPGDTVSNFTLRNTNNSPVPLYSYVNKIMMLLFWSPS